MPRSTRARSLTCGRIGQTSPRNSTIRSPQPPAGRTTLPLRYHGSAPTVLPRLRSCPLPPSTSSPHDAPSPFPSPVNPVCRPTMHRIPFRFVTRLTAAALLCLVFVTRPLLAQAATAGTVTGRVQDSTARLSLEKARVNIVGTSRETFTDAFGE